MLSALNISKLYRIYNRPADRLMEAIIPLGRDRHQDFWALQDINLSLAKGETLGIVGPNGSGKSTLLEILCGILEPTTGRVVRKGRVAALLELGAGFNPEFTGRENVYINGEIMGLSRAEIDRAIGSIEEFAEIGEFFDHPVKLYSSGMYVRLAFSTAIHVEPDILVVDEALAVGDAVFSSRCVRKFEELQRGGMTILFVSHDLGLVKQICHRAIFLHHGRVVEEGEPSHVINRYVGTVLERQKAELAPAGTGGPAAPMQFSHRHGDRLAEVTAVEILNSSEQPTRAANGGERLRISFTARFHQDQAEPMAGILIRTRTGLDVFGTNTKAEGVEIGSVRAGDAIQVEFEFDCWLTAQEYTLTVAVQHPDGHSHDWLDDVIVFRVIEARRLAGVANLHPIVAVRKVPVE